MVASAVCCNLVYKSVNRNYNRSTRIVHLGYYAYAKFDNMPRALFYARSNRLTRCSKEITSVRTNDYSIKLGLSSRCRFNRKAKSRPSTPDKRGNVCQFHLYSKDAGLSDQRAAISLLMLIIWVM